MKTKLLFLLIILSLVGCKDTVDTVIKEEPLIVVDTTKKGIIGEPESSLEIITKRDSTLLKRVSKYWISKTRTYERYEYFDSLGREYKQVDISKNEDGFEHAYTWFDTSKEVYWIARIDSNFRKNGSIKEVSQEYLNTVLTEYYNSKNKVYKKLISSKELIHLYLEEGNKFYVMRKDIPIAYTEWMQTSKTDFGHAIKLFYDSETLAQIRFKKLYKIALN